MARGTLHSTNVGWSHAHTTVVLIVEPHSVFSMSQCGCPKDPNQTMPMVDGGWEVVRSQHNILRLRLGFQSYGGRVPRGPIPVTAR